MKISALQKARAAYQPKLPQALTGTVKLCEGAAVSIIKKKAKFCPECGTKQNLSCPNCGSEVRKNAKFCSECGTKLLKENKERVCECGAKLTNDDNFCPECGKEIK